MSYNLNALSGYLHKKGKINKGWKRRWCTLDINTQVLNYYELKEVQYLCGTIEMSSVEKIEVLHFSDENANYNQFSVEFIKLLPKYIYYNTRCMSDFARTFQLTLNKTNRKYVFYADTHETFLKWIHLLQKCVYGGIVCEAYLHKQTQVLKKYKIYWFVLNCYKQLKYYENETKNKYLGCIELHIAKLIADDARKNSNENCIAIHLPSKVLYVSANSVKQKVKWQRYIKSVIWDDYQSSDQQLEKPMNTGMKKKRMKFRNRNENAVSCENSPNIYPLESKISEYDEIDIDINVDDEESEYDEIDIDFIEHDMSLLAINCSSKDLNSSSNMNMGALQKAFSSSYIEHIHHGSGRISGALNKPIVSNINDHILLNQWNQIQAMQQQQRRKGTSISMMMPQVMSYNQGLDEIVQLQKNSNKSMMMISKNVEKMSNAMIKMNKNFQQNVDDSVMPIMGKMANQFQVGIRHRDRNQYVKNTSLPFQPQVRSLANLPTPDDEKKVNTSAKFNSKYKSMPVVFKPVLQPSISNEVEISAQADDNGRRMGGQMPLQMPLKANSYQIEEEKRNLRDHKQSNSVGNVHESGILGGMGGSNVGNNKYNKQMEMFFHNPLPSQYNPSLISNNMNFNNNSQNISNNNYAQFVRNTGAGKVFEFLELNKSGKIVLSNMGSMVEVTDVNNREWVNVFGTVVTAKFDVVYHWRLKIVSLNGDFPAMIGVMDISLVSQYFYSKVPFVKCEYGYGIDMNCNLRCNGEIFGKYCESLKIGDIVDLYVDMRSWMLRFGINGKPFKIKCQLNKAFYKLAIAMFGEKHCLQIVDICIEENRGKHQETSYI